MQFTGTRRRILHQVDDQRVEDAAEDGDEVSDVVRKVTVVGREHAEIVADQVKAGEVHGADVVESGEEFVDVRGQGLGGDRATNGRRVRQRHDQVHIDLKVVRRSGLPGANWRGDRSPTAPELHQNALHQCAKEGFQTLHHRSPPTGQPDPPRSWHEYSYAA